MNSERARFRGHSAQGAAQVVRTIGFGELHPGAVRTVIIGLLVAILSTKNYAQDAATTHRADANLVTITFSVEKSGRLLKALAPDDIEVLENGRPQRVAFLEPLISASTSVDLVLLVDRSASVLEDSAAHVESLVRHVARAMVDIPGAKVTLFTFDTKLIRFTGRAVTEPEIERAASCLCRPSKAGDPSCASSLASFQLRLPSRRTADRRGSSWIFESIIAALRAVGKASPDTRRLLLVVSDGVPSTTTEPGEAASVAHELSIPVYPVVVGREQRKQRAGVLSQAPPTVGGPAVAQIDALDNQSVQFARLGEMTGGRSYDLRATGQEVYTGVVRSAMMHAMNQFVVGYTPTNGPGSAVRRKAEVRLRSRSLGTVRGGKRSLSNGLLRNDYSRSR